MFFFIGTRHFVHLCKFSLARTDLLHWSDKNNLNKPDNKCFFLLMYFNFIYKGMWHTVKYSFSDLFNNRTQKHYTTNNIQAIHNTMYAYKTEPKPLMERLFQKLLYVSIPLRGSNSVMHIYSQQLYWKGSIIVQSHKSLSITKLHKTHFNSKLNLVRDKLFAFAIRTQNVCVSSDDTWSLRVVEQHWTNA